MGTSNPLTPILESLFWTYTHTHQDLDTAPGFSMTPSEHLPARYRRGAPKNVLHSSSGELFSETGLTWGAKSGGSGKGGCTTVINVEGEG